MSLKKCFTHSHLAVHLATLFNEINVHKKHNQFDEECLGDLYFSLEN